MLDKHPFSELFYMFSTELMEKAPAQTVSILIKQGHKLDLLKVINAMIIPNPDERFVNILKTSHSHKFKINLLLMFYKYNRLWK